VHDEDVLERDGEVESSNLQREQVAVVSGREVVMMTARKSRCGRAICDAMDPTPDKGRKKSQ
jgi:hypothetical protein